MLDVKVLIVGSVMIRIVPARRKKERFEEIERDSSKDVIGNVWIR